MKCPIDQNTLVISERGGIEIDYCPECRGVWLDRGELDKLIDRAGSGSAAFAGQPDAPAVASRPTSAAGSAGARDQAYYDEQHRAWQQTGGYEQRGQDPRGYDQRGQDQRGYDQRGYDRGGYGQPRRKKKDNWLSELFD